MAPVPKAAERLRSETLVLLPSQCSCMPVFGPCRKTEGKSTTPMRSRSGSSSKFQLSSALAGLKVSKRPGPKVGSWWTKSSKRSTMVSSRSRTMPMPTYLSASRFTVSSSMPMASIVVRKRSGLKRSSTAARARKPWKAERSTVFDGIPGTISGAAPGPVRTLPAWQPAQLRKIRSRPMVERSEVPTGRGWRISGGSAAGSSVIRPKAPQPSSSRPGGSRSRNSTGIATHMA